MRVSYGKKQKKSFSKEFGAPKKAVKATARFEAENSFEAVARKWFEKHKDSWVESHAKKIIARLEKDIFPLIGAKTVGNISAPELLPKPAGKFCANQ